MNKTIHTIEKNTNQLTSENAKLLNLSVVVFVDCCLEQIINCQNIGICKLPPPITTDLSFEFVNAVFLSGDLFINNQIDSDQFDHHLTIPSSRNNIIQQSESIKLCQVIIMNGCKQYQCTEQMARKRFER